MYLFEVMFLFEVTKIGHLFLMEIVRTSRVVLCKLKLSYSDERIRTPKKKPQSP